MIKKEFLTKEYTEHLVKKMMEAEKLLIVCSQNVYPHSHQIRSADANNSFSIEFYPQLTSKPISNSDFKEVFQPQKKN